MVDDDELSLAPSITTLRSRSSILPNGESAFDVAYRLPQHKLSRYLRPFRQVNTGYKSFINAVCISARHVPIQIRDYGKEELRMRVCGVIGGSGYSIVFFDAEQVGVKALVRIQSITFLITLSLCRP